MMIAAAESPPGDQRSPHLKSRSIPGRSSQRRIPHVIAMRPSEVYVAGNGDVKTGWKPACRTGEMEEIVVSVSAMLRREPGNYAQVAYRSTS